MKSIVFELQRDALDKDVAVSDLLRKALVVARKLGITEFDAWISKELNGYEKGDLFPDYRLLHGEVQGLNPFHGWQPVLFENPKNAEYASQRYCTQSIVELESLIRNPTRTDKLGIRFPPEAEKALLDSLEVPTNIILSISDASLARVVDAARTIVLNWTLKLEQDGIRGEEFTFTQDEKQAASGTAYHVMNFYGSVQGAQIQQASNHATQISAQVKIDFDALKQFLEELTRKIPDIGVAESHNPTLNADVATIAAQLKSAKPKSSIIKECLQSVRSILENTGGTLASELLIKLGPLLAQWAMG